jgi:predicted RecA/RadA family phage recombinase
MRNYVQEGDRISFPAPFAVASGVAAVIGSVLCVPTHDAAAGQVATFQVEDVVALPKLASAVITPCQRLIWDKAAGQFKTSGAATGDLVNAAYAVESAGAGTTVVKVALTNEAASLAP